MVASLLRAWCALISIISISIGAVFIRTPFKSDIKYALKGHVVSISSLFYPS